MQKRAKSPHWEYQKRAGGPLRSPMTDHNDVRHPNPKKNTKKQTNKTKRTATKTKTKKTTKQTPKNTAKKTGKQRWVVSSALCELNSNLCAEMSAGHPVNQTRTTTDTITNWPGEGAKTTLPVAETQGPPSQDPGDHNETPTGHNRHLPLSEFAPCKPMN